MLASLAVAFVCVMVSVTYPIFDTDLWQHLLVGKAMWTLRAVPQTQIWSWPTYGATDVTSSYSWLFRALLWPVWTLGGAWGLFAWRWITTLAIFAILFFTVRRMGARGLAALFVLVLAALAYRQRAQVRPETLAAVWLVLVVAILETRRHGGPDRSPWLVLVLWLWANTHISYDLGFLIVGFHLAGDLASQHGGRAGVPPAATRRLVACALIAAAVAFVNPYGWRALWQPFDFLLFWRHEPIFRDIGELQPLAWAGNLRNGLPLLVAGWPLLLARRARRRGLDLVELLSCACFTPLPLLSQRYLSVYAIVAAPFAARDLADALAAWRAPAWAARPWARAACVSAAVLTIAAAEWSRPDLRPGVGLDVSGVPVAACDFMVARGVRGHGFTPYPFGGYLLWRFWPDSTRLPFMDIHQSGTREIRRLYQDAYSDDGAWRALDARYRFDFCLLARVPVPGQTLLDRLDADSTWALVFLDDVAALYVRRDGRLLGLAPDLAYRLLPAGPARLAPLSEAWSRDSTLADALSAELARQARESRRNASAWNLLGYIANGRGRDEQARAAFERAVELNPRLVPGAHAMLARILLRQGRPREALDEIAAERRGTGASSTLDVLEGRAWARLGDRDRARAAYRRALDRNPADAVANEALRQLERAPDAR
jgi:hypothetical protein